MVKGRGGGRGLLGGGRRQTSPMKLFFPTCIREIIFFIFKELVFTEKNFDRPNMSKLEIISAYQTHP